MPFHPRPGKVRKSFTFKERRAQPASSAPMALKIGIPATRGGRSRAEVEQRHKIEASAESLYAMQNDSVEFVRKILKVEPDPWQLEFLRAVDSGADVAWKSGHGVGKSAALSWVIIQTLACFPYSKVPCTAPTQHQLNDILWSELAYWLDRSLLKGMLKWTATKLTVSGYEESWFAAARSCRVPENLAGFHAPKLRFIVDEASGVADPIFTVIDGTKTTQGAQVILTGNPTQRSGAFFEAFHKSKKLWKTGTVSSETAPQVNPSYAGDMADKWGKDSDIYRVRVLGEFPLAEARGFISLDLVEAALARQFKLKGPREMGIDVARYGDDETVFAIRHGKTLVKLDGRRGYGVNKTIGRAVKYVREYHLTNVKVDDTGVGGGVTDVLQEVLESEGLGFCRVTACNNGGPGNENYHREGDIYYGDLKDRLRKGTIALINDDELIGQLTTRLYEVNLVGKIQLESKKLMKKRNLPSPDRADAVVLAYAKPIPPPAGESLTVSNTWQAYRATGLDRKMGHHGTLGHRLVR